MRLLFLSIVFGLFAWSAGAVTMTFKGLTTLPVGSYSENGITAQSDNFGLGTWQRLGTAHMDSEGGNFAAKISFSMATMFNAVSFDLLPLGTTFVSCDALRACTPAIYNNVQVQGFRNGRLAASLLFDMGVRNRTVDLGGRFSSLSSLTVSVLAGGPIGPGPMPGDYCLSRPCAHFDLDNVTLAAIAPVPLPAALFLFGSALAGIGLVVAGRRTHRTQPDLRKS